MGCIVINFMKIIYRKRKNPARRKEPKLPKTNKF